MEADEKRKSKRLDSYKNNLTFATSFATSQLPRFLPVLSQCPNQLTQKSNWQTNLQGTFEYLQCKLLGW